MDIHYLSIADLHAKYLAGELSPVDVTEAALKQIVEKDAAINAFVTVTAEIARKAARAAEAKLKRYEGKLPRLFGVPLGLKDLSDSLQGVRNTYGSKAFADHVAQKTAAHVQRLLDAGAIVVGKTNTSEFGHKNTTDNLVSGATSTPFCIGSNAGGSSGGSAAAVAAGMATVALGSDGGGSIRVPAAACGVYGFKPTFGQAPWINRPNAFGTLAPFTHKGPLARNVADAVAMLDVLGQPLVGDPFGPTAFVESYQSALDGKVKNLRVAYVPTLCRLVPQADVLARIRAGANAFAAAGAHVTELDDPIPIHYSDLERIWTGLYVVFAADTALSLEGIGTDVDSPRGKLLSASFRGLVEKGLSMKAIDFQTFNHERTRVLDAVDRIFEEYDLLITPTNVVAGVPNAPVGTETFGPSFVGDLPVSNTMGWSLAYLFNLTGHPVASVPVGMTPSGLPVGMQIVGARHADRQVLGASADIERHLPWADSYKSL
ncbi:MAG: amidase family protein [Burkholderiaceae bacterium]